MEILDIHTHRVKENSSQCIYSCLPTAFNPQEGGYYSVGVHPWYINADTGKELEYLKKIASNPQILAIGEAGIDKLITTPLSIQMDIFRHHIELSETLNKPLIIHSVKSVNEIVMLKKELSPKATWIIHGFRGKRELAQQLFAHGIYLSFGEQFQENALKCIPLERLLLETDESDKNILEIYQTVAKILNLSVEKLQEQIQQNIKQLFFNR
ncbi:TatD family hydrolase [Bacteroides sedimenti]|uniref:TatD family hydrolase n=1 Tax=Bacteroides sedimenti TaxID=2136147 RepID=A0ABN6Z5X2_9BACE